MIITILIGVVKNLISYLIFDHSLLQLDRSVKLLVKMFRFADTGKFYNRGILYYNNHKMAQKIIKTGNSAAVTIPAEFFDALGLKIGDWVEARMDYKKGTVTFKFPNSRQLPLGKGNVNSRHQAPK